MSEKIKQTQGKPWTVSGRFGSFEEAHALRTKLKSGDMDAKIHSQVGGFAVKTRAVEKPAAEPKAPKAKKAQK